MTTNYRFKNVLKGHQIPARGKRRRSVALGKDLNLKIVRIRTFKKKGILFRTKTQIPFTPEDRLRKYRPKGKNCIAHRIYADGFLLMSFTQGVALG